MSFHDEHESENENENAGAPIASASTSAPNYRLSVPLTPVTFSVNNAGGRSRIINIYGDNNHIDSARYYYSGRDGGGEEIRRRRATRAGEAEEAEEEDHEALVQHRTRTPSTAPGEYEYDGRRDGGGSSDNRRSPPMAAAAMSIQFHVALNGPPCEAQIVITYRVVAVSTGVLFFFE
ncbi:hypothetical protein FIBSPDRAFT_1040922 [Athelia psychrophila]|uniref:Uncharacterized protein n=1 Tax=Athelia psychrophila TaxID=1759441 RepID=A0A166PSC5_9AGAM|nr:hypothetical protein FIBSPDRAFT_1040922 [Fibularhizoctonia sp. CBS 109695]